MKHKYNKKLNIRLVSAIIRAAETVGGIQYLEMPCNHKKWRTCTSVCLGNQWLYYNNTKTHSTNIIKM